MVNQKTVCHKRVPDCSSVKPILRKRSISQGPKERPCKRVSFAATHGGGHSRFVSSRTKSQPEFGQALKDEPPRSHCDGIDVSICRLGSVCQGGSGDAVTPSTGRAQIPDNNAENASSLFMKDLPSNSSSCVKYQTGFTSDTNQGEDRNLQMISPTGLVLPQNGPAKEITWSFEVVDCGKIRLCEGIIAHVSAKVSCKAFELSKKLAPFQRFKMHPRSDFYPEIFQKKCANRNDIALYFYPRDPEKSVMQYSELLRDMHRKDLMLRCYMHNTELLVFSSTLLHVDCQRMGKDFFMWGVFRHQKGNTGGQMTVAHKPGTRAREQ